MVSGIQLITDASAEPISLVEAKAYLRVDTSDTSSDLLIPVLIKAARKQCELYTRLAFITQTWELWLDEFPQGNSRSREWWDGTREGSIAALTGSLGAIEVPKAPLLSVVSLNTYGFDDAPTAFDTTLLQLNTASRPGRVFLKYGQIWPVNLRPNAAIALRFTAGYGPASTDVPQDLITACYLLLAHYFENRGVIIEGRGLEMPLSVKTILDQYKVKSL